METHTREGVLSARDQYEEDETNQTRPRTPTLTVYAFDAQLGRRRRYRISLEVLFEEMNPGPRGRSIRVVENNAGWDRYNEPVDHDSRDLRAAGGLDPDVGDPRLHQLKVRCRCDEGDRQLRARLGTWGPRCCWRGSATKND